MYQRPQTPNNLDNNIFSTPRKLVHSFQDPTNVNSVCFEKQARRSRNHSLSDCQWSLVSRCDQNCISPDDYEFGDGENLYDDVEKFPGGFESVSSTEDVPTDADLQMSRKVIAENKIARQKVNLKLVCGLSFAVLAVCTPLFWLSNQDEGGCLVPT